MFKKITSTLTKKCCHWYCACQTFCCNHWYMKKSNTYLLIQFNNHKYYSLGVEVILKGKGKGYNKVERTFLEFIPKYRYRRKLAFNWLTRSMRLRTLTSLVSRKCVNTLNIWGASSYYVRRGDLRSNVRFGVYPKAQVQKKASFQLANTIHDTNDLYISSTMEMC